MISIYKSFELFNNDKITNVVIVTIIIIVIIFILYVYIRRERRYYEIL